MGLFDKLKSKKEAKPSKKKEADEEFDIGQDGVKFRAIIELLGAPKKYIEDTMKAFVDKMKKNPDYKVLKTTISKVKKLEKGEKESIPGAKEEQSDLFSTFAEVEVGVRKKAKLFDFCFEFLPSSIEVLEPMSMSFPANELSGFLTDIQGTLHKVDFALKQTRAANQILTKNMIQMLQNNIILALKDKDKELSELSKNVGIPEEQLKPFVEKMVAANELRFENNKYGVAR
jgi:hypothetical protein